MNFNIDEIIKRNANKFDKDPALFLEEDLSTEKSECLNSRASSTSTDKEICEYKVSQKPSRKISKDQLKVLRKIPSTEAKKIEKKVYTPQKPSRKRTKEQLRVLRRFFWCDPEWSRETYMQAAIEAGIKESQAYKWGYHQKISHKISFDRSYKKGIRNLNTIVENILNEISHKNYDEDDYDALIRDDFIPEEAFM